MVNAAVRIGSMPQVNVGTSTVSALAATSNTGPLTGTVVNRGPNSVWLELTGAAATITVGPGNGNASELRVDEAVDVNVHIDQALRCRCAAGESARLDVIASGV